MARKTKGGTPRASKSSASTKTPVKLSKAQRVEIRAVKASNLSKGYKERLLRGLRAGKTRQEARGKKPGEHKERVAKERKHQGGLSNYEVNKVIEFYQVWNAQGTKDQTTDQMIRLAQERGYEWFKVYVKGWHRLRNLPESERANRKLGRRNYVYEELVEELEFNEPEDLSWLYYG